MTQRGDAYALAIVLYGRDTDLPLDSIADNLYDTIEALDYGCDERKADLYAQLAEGLTQDTKFADAVEFISTAMTRTQLRYPRG